MDRISSFMDGELDRDAAADACARLARDPDARECWGIFHLIGDALRGECRMAPGFEARLKARLAAEPTVLAPRRMPARRAATFALTAVASLAAVALVGWIALYNPLSPQQQIAAVPVPAVTPVALPPAQAELANVPSDGAMNEYLIAHQEFSPSTAIQGLAPYIRGVSETRAARGERE
ncbi:MAG: sigma-E factor negative regulatory protein [Burkholderiales bacterium]|nr:sigma-E factor negative regulatory protein [Burkholderiales bacterium]